MDEISQLSPKKHIEYIRNKMGIGQSKGRNDWLTRSLHNAIRRLSEDLYSKDIHFVLEIIQNAEDNEYLNTEPELIFHFLQEDPTRKDINEGALLIINNETGFQKENVRAICDIGETTKDKRQGYIGEKGIGFKSTFLVSSQPHIFSAGYRFRFQEEKDPAAGFGYIIPYWVTSEYPIIESFLEKTCILLPLKAQKRETVENQLRSISPETILFLQKIKRLIVKQDDAIITNVIRDDQAKPLVGLSKDDIEERYWLIEVDFDVPEGVIEEKREGINSRTVCIAFPLDKPQVEGEKVYAFLPTLVKSGLDFLVNADFLLSSNRESIRENLEWNIWLRDCVTPTFIDAFESLLRTKKFKFSPYNFIPLIDNIADPFFVPVAEQIQTDLKQRKIVWAANGRSLVNPHQARFAPSAFRKLFFGNRIPRQLRETPLVHPRLEGETIAVRLKELGVKPIYDTDVISCLKDGEWLDTRNRDWFLELYSYLSDHKWATKDKLKEVSIILKEGGGRINGQNSWIYFPTEDALGLSRKNKTILNYLDIEFLDKTLYKKIEENRKLISWLGNVLDVEELNLQNMCRQLISKLSTERDNLTAPSLIRYSRFLRDNLKDLESSIISQIKESLPLLLDDNRIIPPKQWGWDREEPLVVPKNIDPETGWQHAFPEPQDHEHMYILSGRYIDNRRNVNLERKLWLKFFLSLGATDSPWPPKKEWEFYYSIPTEVPIHLKSNIDREYSTREQKLIDWTAPKWLRMLGDGSKNNENINKCNALIVWLRKHISSSRTPSWQNAEYRWHYYSWHRRNYKSEIFHFMIHAPWFASTKGFMRPFEVFLDKPEIREFFGEALPYSLIEVNENIADFLNLKTSATFDQVFTLLQDLSSRPADDINPELISRIYSFLNERWNHDQLVMFEENSLILSLKPEPAWATTKQVIWTDRSDVFGDLYGYISPDYEHLSDFFINKLEIARDVGDKEYAQAWLNLNNRKQQPEQVEAALERIFPVVLQVAKEVDKPEWWDDFTQNVKIWTQEDHFVNPSDVYVPDDGELRSILRKVGVEFVWRPSKDSFSDYLSLYSSIGVKPLSESVAIKAYIEGDISTNEFSKNELITDAAKYAICYYLRNEMHSQYDQLFTNRLLELFLQTNEIHVDQLNITYLISGISALFNNGTAHWDQSIRVLYLSNQFSFDDWETEVSSIIARRMVGYQSVKHLENFIARVLGASKEKVYAIIKKKNWNFTKEEREFVQEKMKEKFIVFDHEENTNSDSTSTGQVYSDVIRRSKVSDPEQRREKVRSDPRARQSSSRQRTELWRPRMRSYAEPKEATSSERKGTDSDKKKEIEMAGVNCVMDYERRQGRYPYELPPNHEGWDINVFSKQVPDDISLSGDGAIRLIEVKATEYSWDGWGIGHTVAEYREARKAGGNYYLYVVEKALDGSWKKDPIIICDPVSYISEYRFDDQWKKIGQTYQDDSNFNNTNSPYEDMYQDYVDD